MSKQCEFCGKKPQTGNYVSHSNIKTKRVFNPNLQNVRHQFANGEVAFQASTFTRPSVQPAARPADTDERSLAFNFDEAKTEEPSDSAPAPEDDDFDLDDFDDASDVPSGQTNAFEVADVPAGVLNVPSTIAPVPGEQPATMGSFFF